MAEQIAKEGVAFYLEQNPGIVAVLLAMVRDRNSRNFGVSEYSIFYDNSGLGYQEVHLALAELENQGIITKRLQQIGTAGTSATLYRLADCDVKVVVKPKNS